MTDAAKLDLGSNNAPEAPAKRKHPRGWTPGTSKFDDKWLLKVELPTREERQFYLSEKLEDGCSLRIVIGFGSKKRWSAATYDQNGRSVQTPLGHFPELRCREAREKARDVFKAARKDPKRREREKSAGTFGETSSRWFKAEIAGRGLIEEDEIKRRLDRYVLFDREGKPRWINKPFASIKRHDTTELLDTIQKEIQEGPRKAKGAVQTDAIGRTLIAVFTYMIDRMPDSWTPPIPTQKRAAKVKRKRVLTDDELNKVWSTASDGASDEYGRFLKFLLGTAQRDGKTLQMRREDLKGDTWFIPRNDDREKRAPSFIKLSPMMLSIVSEQLRSHNHDRVWNCVALSRHKREFSERCKIPHWVLHDLRRTARTRLGKLKDKDGKTAVLPHIAEAALGHTLKITDVQDTYDHADYSDEVSQALALWSVELARIVGENVVDFKSAKHA